MSLSSRIIDSKTRVSKIDALKEIIRVWGLEPEKILTREALIQGATTHPGPREPRKPSAPDLTDTLKELVRREAMVQMHSVGGGPAGI